MLKLPKDVQFIVTDFDGVITDGFLYISNETENYNKRISFKDIMGMSLAVKNDYKIAIISGEMSPVIDFVANKFNLVDIHKGIKDKASVLRQIAEKYNLDLSKVVYIGDDVNDIPALELVGFPVTVPDANYKVVNLDNIQITAAEGGNGAFREVVDSILA